MPKEGSNAWYRAYADRFYLDKANRDLYLYRSSSSKLGLNSGLVIPALETLDGMDPSVHLTAIDAHVAEMLADLLKGGQLLHIPTNAGWTEGKSGAGAPVALQEISRICVNTTVTVSTTDLLYAFIYGFGGAGLEFYLKNWGKKTYIFFSVARQLSDAEVVAFLQFKGTNGIGELAHKGVGIRMDNLTMVGTSFGASQADTALDITMTSQYQYDGVIIHDPSVPKIEWYVDIGDGNGMVLRGTQSTATKIPSGIAVLYAMASIKNGATGGVDATLSLMQPKIWQAR